MGRRKRPPSAPQGRSGRIPGDIAAERRQITQTLCARARVVHGMTVIADVLDFVWAQDVWTTDRHREYGAPSDSMITSVWKSLNPENIDLCANLENETVQRTAAEERKAAIVRARETVNRWYGIERELILVRDEQDGGRERRLLEERIGKAQEHRMDAEKQLAACTALIDDESFDSAQLRSEVIGILARNRAHFTPDECERVAAIFAVVELDDVGDPDPDLPDYMQ